MTLPKHNHEFFHPYEMLYILSMEKRHPIFYYYAHQITDDINLADVVVEIAGEFHPRAEAYKKMTDKIIVELPAGVCFETDSQKALRESDWEVIKELEKLLPEDHPLRVKRDALRSAVDNEQNLKPEELDHLLAKDLGGS